MMQQAVAHACFVYVAGLGVADTKVFVPAVLVCALFQVALEREDVVHECVLEFLHVLLLALAAHEFTPCGEQVFYRDDILVWMSELNATRTTPPPSRPLLPVLERIKSAYILWHECHSKLLKIHQYTIGAKVDILFVEVMEMVSAAVFLPKTEKLPYLRIAIRKIDTVKLLLLVLWESKSLDTKKYVALSGRMDEVGKMLGGWQGQLTKLDPA
jgi:hypothetical protein